MFICEKCGYILNTKKIKSKLGDVVNNELIETFINDTLNNKDIKYLIEFSLDNLLNSDKYKKSSSKDKIKLNYEKLFTNAYFQCDNCGFKFQMANGTIIYKNNIINDDTLLLSNINIEQKVNDLTLPRTKNYICKNKECSSNKNLKDINREALYFRTQNSYQLIYICMNCKTSWFN